MQLTSRTFRPNGVIPGRCAFAVRHPRDRIRLSHNRNPHLAWSQVPDATRSFVLLCLDTEVPTRADDVNQPDREVPWALPRAEFSHWVMVDIAPDVREIEEGACSQGVTARGKTQPLGPEGSRQGVNDYTGWFQNDPDMAGTYLGYDGPCPPWNDARIHRYRFELFATDLERCPVEGAFTAEAVRTALEGHVLAQAAIVGRYSLNPRIRLR